MKLLLITAFTFLTALSFSQTNNFSVNFDGTNDYINYGNNIVISNFPITIQFDVKLPVGYQSNDDARIFNSCESINNYYGFWCQITSSSITISYGTGNSQGSTGRRSKDATHSITENTWVNVACVINGATDMKIYLNGSDIGGTYSGTGGTYTPSDGNDAFSGFAETTTLASYSEQKIDNLAIWDIELSSTEINEYQTCPPTGSETGLVAFWNYETGTGTTVSDLTGNGNDGTLVNGVTWSSDVPGSCSLSVGELNNQETKVLVQVTDLLGKTTDIKPNTVLIYKYSDGSIERRFVFE